MATRPLYYGYVIVAAAFVAQFFSIGVISYLAGAFMDPMNEALGWTRAEFTYSRSLAQIIMALTGFVVGGYVDRVGARRLMLVGTFVLGGALALQSQITQLWHWVLLNGIVTTVGCALIGNLVVNVTLAKWFVERRGQVVAWAAMGVSLGGVVLTPLATWAVDTLGWRDAWVLLGVMTFVCMLPIGLLMRRAPEDYGLHPDGKTQADVSAGLAERARLDFERSLTRGQAIRTTSFWELVIAFGFFQINIVVVLLHSLPYLADAGFSRAEAAASLVIASIPAMLSKPIWGYYIDRTQPKPLAAISASTTGVALGFIVLAVTNDSLLGAYAAFFLLGIGWGGMLPLQEVIWASFFGRRYLGAVRSAALPVALVFGALAPLLVAFYRDSFGSYHTALWVVAVLNIMSGLMIYRVKPPQFQPAQTAS